MMDGSELNSELNIDVYLTSQVSLALNRLESHNLTFESTESLDSSSEDSLLDDCHITNAVSLNDIIYEIAALETSVQKLNLEVASLQERLNNKQSDLLNNGRETSTDNMELFSHNIIDQALQLLSEPHSTSDSNISAFELPSLPVKKLKMEIELNKALTGLEFLSISSETIRKDSTQLWRVHRHKGIVHGLLFQTTFTTIEELATPELTKIVNLHIEVDQTISTELKTFIQWICRSCDLMDLYQTFSTYVLRVFERQQTLCHIKQSFPGVVICEEDNISTVNVKNKAGTCYIITWKLSLTRNGLVSEDLTIHNDTLCESVLPREMLNHLPQIIERLVKKYDCRSVLIKLITSICN